ncbi:MAG: hypothetical protein R3277_00660 [Brumimicrobium sp.]|nr:hypothetical protein [Brumimicrobium sp.]
MDVLRLIIYGNYLIAFSAGFLAMSFAKHLGNNSEVEVFLTVFFATLGTYNFQRIPRLNEVLESSSPRHVWLNRFKPLVFINAITGLLGAGVLYFFVLEPKNDFIFLFVLFLLSIFYALKLFGGSALRDLPFIKIHLIAFVWLLVCFVWPLVRIESNLGSYIEPGLSLYLFILALTIPFDIRDLYYDEESKKTIPQLIGVQGSKYFALLFLLSAFVLILIYDQKFIYNVFFWISFFGGAALIYFSNTQRKEMYFSGLIDGWILFYGCMFYYQQV